MSASIDYRFYDTLSGVYVMGTGVRRTDVRRTGVRRTGVRFDLCPQGVDNHRG